MDALRIFEGVLEFAQPTYTCFVDLDKISMRFLVCCYEPFGLAVWLHQVVASSSHWIYISYISGLGWQHLGFTQDEPLEEPGAGKDSHYS